MAAVVKMRRSQRVLMTNPLKEESGVKMTISLELTGVIHKELFNLLGDGGIWFQLKHLSFLGLENETAVYYCCYTDCC